MVNSNFSLPSKAPATATSLLSLLRIPQSYKTVWEVDSVEEFKHAFIDLFKRHYLAYKQGVLRYQPPDVGSAANEVVKALKLSDLAQECRVFEPLAILIDLDHGQHVNDIDCSTDVPLNFPPNNTFAASDCILVEERFERVEIPRYRYRYDLEGFLYVLIWVVNHCEPGSKRKRLTQRDLASWETCYDIDKHQRTKSAIRYYFDDEYGVESFQQLGQEWVRPMLYLYEEVTKAPLSWFRSTSARSSEELQARREARQDFRGILIYWCPEHSLAIARPIVVDTPPTRLENLWAVASPGVCRCVLLCSVSKLHNVFECPPAWNGIARF